MSEWKDSNLSEVNDTSILRNISFCVNGPFHHIKLFYILAILPLRQLTE